MSAPSRSLDFMEEMEEEDDEELDEEVEYIECERWRVLALWPLIGLIFEVVRDAVALEEALADVVDSTLALIRIRRGWKNLSFHSVMTDLILWRRSGVSSSTKTRGSTPFSLLNFSFADSYRIGKR